MGAAPRALTTCLAMVFIGLAAGCSGFSFFVANAPDAFRSAKRAGDLAYGPNARQRLDVYGPKHCRDCPVIVFFYGGSWTSGRKSEYAFVGAALARRGYVVVIPDYRLFPEVRFPAFLDDGASAVAFARTHAAEFGGDADRLVLMGHSAGAWMAAMLALNPSYLKAAGVPREAIAALVGLSGPYALDPDTDTLRTIFASPYSVRNWQPVRFASGSAPPTLLLHGAADRVVYVTHTEELRDELLKHGATVETHIYPNRGHVDTIGSFTLVAGFRTPALQQVVAFLGRVTGKAEAGQ